MQNRYTLKTIKELVYKELDEYSKNGEQTGEYGFSKSDLSERLTDALNGAFTRACLSMKAITALPKAMFCLTIP